MELVALVELIYTHPCFLPGVKEVVVAKVQELFFQPELAAMVAVVELPLFLSARVAPVEVAADIFLF